MRGTVGVASKVFGSIQKNKVNVSMITQGSSELNLAFVVKNSDTSALLFVHYTMNLNLTKSIKIKSFKGNKDQSMIMLKKLVAIIVIGIFATSIITISHFQIKFVDAGSRKKIHFTQT